MIEITIQEIRGNDHLGGVTHGKEVITKLADAFQLLKAWSDVHARKARKHLR